MATPTWGGIDPSDVIADYQRARIKSYMRVAPAALLLYDYLLTLGSEMNVMWPSRMSPMKALYLYTRYSAFVDVTMAVYYQLKTDVPAILCKRIYSIAAWLIVIGIIVAEVILMVRTWAIWNRSRRMAAVLIGISVVAVVGACVMEGLYLKTLNFTTPPGPTYPGCHLMGGNVTLGVNFIIIIVIETVVLILTLTGGIQRFRFAATGQKGLVSVLYRDGMLFYVYLFGISLLNFIVILVLPASPNSSFITPAVADGGSSARLTVET
ncbi:hypothetical protein EIP91_002297 [Steccherinum ochraceum]|uniref:DUF6533 domain-containing protein n=1 Tax=Steccherinum ochraceum TaxID=92696 RepID=A0A4R0RCI4_9APHY|nr:hypothetical protein EIP91_002297 [Steccherinum ochraceum]